MIVDYVLRYTLLSTNAKPPHRASDKAAGLDLYSSHDCDIAGGSKAIIYTGLAIELPSNTYGLIAGRSGMAFRHDIIPFNGILDEDYRGVLAVYLRNFSDSDYRVKTGDRIAQLIIQPVCYVNPTSSIALSSTLRGINGFGSTGQ